MQHAAAGIGRLLQRLRAASLAAALLIGTMVWAVHGLAAAQSAQPTDDDPPLVRVVDHGGLCAGGQECSTETAMLATGTAKRQSAGDVAVSYPITPEQIGQLVSLIASADFAALAAPPFTGVCPTAYDGVERIYVFATADGPVTLAGCQVEIDHSAPLIAFVDTIVGAGQPVGTGSLATPMPVSPVGHLEGQVAIRLLRPVERVGVPPPTPSPAVCTAHGLVVYRLGSLLGPTAATAWLCHQGAMFTVGNPARGFPA